MASTSSSQKQALIFGASGISGWALVRECLVYPTEDAFAHVIGLAKQSLKKEEFLLEGEKGSERLEVYSGIDLLDPHVVEAVGKIPDIERTTHVFYVAYAGHNEAYSSGNPFEILTKVNLALLKGAIAAVTSSCPNLESWIMQSGGKGYGFELLGVPGYLESVGYTTPHVESKLPLPSPWGDMIFYTAQHNELIAASAGKSWTFSEIIPDVIVGFAPRTNPICFAQTVGLFLSFYRDIKGAGAEVIFPGSPTVYNSKHSDTSQDILARFEIFAALNPDATAKRRWNIADEDEGDTFANVWPQLCGLFGLKGLPPRESTDENSEPLGASWILAQRSHWSAFESKHSLKPGVIESTPWPLFQMATELAAFDRQYDLSAARGLGFTETRPSIEGYKIAFARFRAAYLMP